MTDIVIVGSGGAGLVAALVAAKRGAKVLVLEKTPWLGGSAAISGGGIWIPCNHLARRAGLRDSPEEAVAYVRNLVGPDVREDLVEAYVAAGAEMLEFLEREDAAHFRVGDQYGDFHPQLEGASRAGRLLNPIEYDARTLGTWFDRLRAPRREFNAPGGMMLAIEDLPHLKAMRSSPQSFFHLAKIGGRFLLDRLRGYARGTRLTMGNAVQANLLRAAVDAGVSFRTEADVVELVTREGRVAGVVVEANGAREEVLAVKGVILATGGFSRSLEMRRSYIPHADEHVSLMTEGSTGDGMRLGLKAGGRVDGDNIVNAVWSLVSVDRGGGQEAIYAHILDVAKPGCLIVDKSGQRFENEGIACSILVSTIHERDAVPAWLIADSRFVRKYGMGLVLSRGLGLRKRLTSGYIVRGDSLSDLAQKIGVDAVGLAGTVERLNGFADKGIDEDFHKGETPNERHLGDATHRPNPCLGRVDKPPYFAIRLVPGDGSTTVGLRIDDRARVLDADDHPIPGLYAAGLDVNAIWRGHEPARGTNLGPAMTFGYIAGRAAAEHSTIQRS